MARNPKNIIEAIVKQVNPQEKKEVWAFLNNVFMGIVSHAEFDSTHEDLLTSILQEVVCDMHTEVLRDKQRSRQWAMQIATWVNGVGAANYAFRGAQNTYGLREAKSIWPG